MRALVLAVGLLVAGCAASVPASKPLDAPPGVSAAMINAPVNPIIDTSGPITSAGAGKLSCTGHAAQGGFMVCKTAPGAAIRVDGGAAAAKAPDARVQVTKADDLGFAVIGFDRDAAGLAHIESTGADFVAGIDIPVAPREFSVQRVDGLPQDTVTPSDPAVLARIQREVAMKNVGFGSRAGGEGFTETWVWPVDGRISGLWGNQRVLNGVPSTPHYGIDIAAPEGTQVRAPAGGTVAFAEPDMHFEGGLVLLDHGQGLITMYLHMSRLDVKAGDVLKQGDPIGAVGMKGRATGPHLCWRMKWRDRYLDPSLMPLTPVRPTSAAVAMPPRG